MTFEKVSEVWRARGNEMGTNSSNSRNNHSAEVYFVVVNVVACWALR